MARKEFAPWRPGTSPIERRPRSWPPACSAASTRGRLRASRTLLRGPALSQSIDRWLDERFGDPWRPSVTRVIDPYTAQTSTQDRGVRRYDIPEGPLETVIAAYQSASGVTVTFPADVVRGITSPGVSGLLTAEQALAKLLAGTSLGFRFTAPFAAVVEIRIASESVDVNGGAAPRITEVHRASPQHAADDHRDSAGADGGAVGDDAARRAAERAGHHDSGG